MRGTYPDRAEAPGSSIGLNRHRAGTAAQNHPRTKAVVVLTILLHHRSCSCCSSAADGATAARATDPSRHTFGSGPPFTVGVEEELFLVDPLTGAQINASTAVQERVGPVDGTVERELHACQLELITEVCETRARRSTRSTACGAPSSTRALG